MIIMNNVFKNLLKVWEAQAKKICYSFTQPDGKKRYTIASDNGGDTIYTSEVSIAKLNSKTLDYDQAYCSDIDDLLDECTLEDIILDYFENYVTFTNDGKAKINEFFTEKFQTDKIIAVKEKNNQQSIMGIIIDFKRDEDFTDAYYNGLACKMPNCKHFMEEISRHGDDINMNDFVDLLDEQEIAELAKLFAARVQACAELIPQGLYVIIDNRIYYLTDSEYKQIYYNNKYSKNNMPNLFEDPGIYQLDLKLLKDKKQVLNILSEIIKSKCLDNKKYLNLDFESIGTTKEIFLANLLSNNSATYEFLDSELKPNESVK